MKKVNNKLLFMFLTIVLTASGLIGCKSVESKSTITDYEIELNNEKIEEAETSKKYDPLVIDLNRNGKYSVNTEKGVYFDYSGDGFAEKTGWIEEGDGLLVYDRNNNGIIDDGSHSIRYG